MRTKTAKKEVFIPQFNLVWATCCTSLSVEEATSRMNATCPTGIASHWRLADKDELPDGFEGDNPWPCNDNPKKCKHMYFLC